MITVESIVDCLLEGAKEPVVSRKDVRRFYDSIKGLLPNPWEKDQSMQVPELKGKLSEESLCLFLNKHWNSMFPDLDTKVVFKPIHDIGHGGQALFNPMTGDVDVGVGGHGALPPHKDVLEALDSLVHELIHAAQYRGITKITVEKAADKLVSTVKRAAGLSISKFISKSSKSWWENVLRKHYGDYIYINTLLELCKRQEEVIKGQTIGNRYFEDPTEIQARAGTSAFGADTPKKRQELTRQMRHSGLSGSGFKHDADRKKYLKTLYQYLHSDE